jgi:hypothetical protein
MTTSHKEDFFSLYLRYTSKTECPIFFHRWTAVTCLAAYLGRRAYFRHGHFTVYPNIYAMLIGSPGTKKSSSIKIGAKLLKLAGYNTFAADKTRQEKFLLDLAEQSERAAKIAGHINNSGEEILDQNLWGEDPDYTSSDSYLDRPPAECFITADEFNNFIGVNNLDFISILGQLWDLEGVFTHRLKNSVDVFIPNPTINILGGNTATGFAQAFPIEAIGQGFFSRLLLIYGEPSGIKYTFPPPPDIELQAKLIDYLHQIKDAVQGEITMTPDAEKLLDTIYISWQGLEDLRFEHYSNRRLSHLLKLCILVTAASIRTVIDKEDVIYANTLLSYTEKLMPKALGEFGKSKHSAVSQKIMVAIDNAAMRGEAITLQGIWKVVHQDIEDRVLMGQLVANLESAGKIQYVQDAGYLPFKNVIDEAVSGTLDWNLLTKIERDML